ncbi:MAG: phosphoglycerate mutase family protein [Microthrixaceae bacterium]
MTTEVLVLRHGQSEWNALGRWQGQENPPLTDLGREQAVEAAQAVGTVDAVFASPLDQAAHRPDLRRASVWVLWWRSTVSWNATRGSGRV